MKYWIGVDIGGTKCAVSLGAGENAQSMQLQKTRRYPTAGTANDMLQVLCEGIRELSDGITIRSIGVSCGGPLDSRSGLILSPPNLPGWNEVPVVQRFSETFSVPCYLQNDADAGALAEWKFGAGKGLENLVFITCGTGFGAGMILNGRLYSGSCDMAGEIGHIRAAQTGPVGYGKPGSYEGFCSGAGIAKIAKTLALAELNEGRSTQFCGSYSELQQITAQTVAQAAGRGDPLALRVFQQTGEWLGRASALLIDLLNPQAIILGSIFVRCEQLLRTPCETVIRQECLRQSASACRILASQLGEHIGNIAALAVAMQEEYT